MSARRHSRTHHKDKDIPMRYMQYLGTSAKITVTGIAVTTVFWLYGHITFLAGIDSLGQISEATLETYLDAMEMEQIILIATAICYLCWSVKAYANAKRLLQMSGGGSLAFWGWIVPFASLVLPCFVLMRIMKGSYLSDKLPNRSWIAICWWLPFLIFAGSQQAMSRTLDIDTTILFMYIGIVAYPIAGSVLIYCVMNSTMLQEKYIDHNPGERDD